MTTGTRQITDTILMVRPAHFGFNVETAENNVFQNNLTDLSIEEIATKAKKEFDNMVDTLVDHGVHIIMIDDTEIPRKTDAIFPNNWISTHRNGDIYLFPMFSPNRRLERRDDIINQLKHSYNVTVKEDILDFEAKDQFLEGTGSMILDRPNKKIYACYSVRTDEEAFTAFANELGYEAIGFVATDTNGIPYYHTNVIMTLGTEIAVICTESIENSEERKRVVENLLADGKKIVDISREQVLAFAGNMMEVQGNAEKNLMVMSSAAFESLTKDQLHIINFHNKIVHLPLTTIEKFGGGSARCMIAEIFLPQKS